MTPEACDDEELVVADFWGCLVLAPCPVCCFGCFCCVCGDGGGSACCCCGCGNGSGCCCF